MVFVAGAVLVEDSSKVDGSTSYIQGETNLVATGGNLTYQIMYLETAEFDTLSISYTAVLNDSNGNAQSGAVSPASGTLSNGVESTLTITAPKTAGKFTLEVTFKSTLNTNPSVTTVKTQTVTVVEPIVLTATIKNVGDVDFTDFVVYFKVDGVLKDDSRTTVSATVGNTATATYNWVVESLPNGKHTFQVVAGSDNIAGATFTGGDGTFYKGYADYSLLNILLGILFIVLIIAVIWFYRKPVKNYGKPKSRR